MNTDLMGLVNQSRWSLNKGDDETNKFLVNFFKSIQTDPLFVSLVPSLTEYEHDKLQYMDQLL